MKRFLSIILAAALVISLVPSVFADGETVYTYYFDNEAYGGEHVISSGKERTYANLALNVEANKKGGVWKAIYSNTYQKRVHEPTDGAGGLTGNGRWGKEYYKNNEHNGNVGWTFEIIVPQKGTYVPTVTLDLASLGAIVSTRIISETERAALGLALTDSDGDIDTVLSKLPVTDAQKKDTYDTTVKGLTIDKSAELELPAVELDAGKNYAVFLIDGVCDKVKEANETEAQTAVIEVRSLELAKVPVARVEIANEDSIINVGESIALLATAYDSNDNVISDTMTFESSAPSVVSVDANGVVTAKAIGEATITATTSNGKTDSIKITVGKIMKYEFTLNSLTDGFNVENDVLDKEGKNDGRNYEYIADGCGQWDMLNAYGSNSLRVYAGNTYFRLARGAEVKTGINGITYRINLPESGKYKLRFNYFEDSLGLKTGVWFADEKMLAEKNITMAGTTSNTGCRRVMASFDPDIEIDTYNKDYVNDFSNPSSSRLSPIIADADYNLAAGEYYIVIGVTGIGFDNSATGGATGVDANGAFSYMLYRGIDLIKIGDYVAPEVPSSPAKTDLFVYSPILGAVTSEDIKVGEKLDIPVGTEITLKAEETVGDYSFVGWKNGAGILLSTNPEETFDIITKTAIMAVYDKKDASSKVEFWNANGSLIKTVPVDAGAKFGDIEKPSASLNGYGAASGWSISDDTEINGIVRAVAVYDYEDTGIAVNNVKVNGTAVEDAVYNQKLNLSESGATYWTRNAKTVAFGESFVHYVFNSANGSAIVAHKGAVTVRPVVTLDTNNGDYSMIEYDAAGMKIVEAGIIYGPNKSISLNSYVTKASVKNIKKHGQFIAAPNPDSSLDQSVARGYIVYINDKNEYKVAYSD